MGHFDRRLVLALAVAIFAISWAAVLFRLAPGLDPRAAAGWRLVIAGGLIGAWLLASRRAGRSGSSGAPAGEARRRALVLGAGAAYGLHFGAWVASLGLVPVALSVTAVTTTPLLLAVVGLVTGRDRPSPRTLVALAFGGGGLAVMAVAAGAGPAGGDTGWGVALAVTGAAAMGLYLLLARRATSLGGATGARSSLAFAGQAALIGGLLLLGAAAMAGVRLGFASVDELLVVAGAAAVPQLVGHTLLTWAVGRTDPTRVALATLGEPVLAGLLAWGVLGESLSGLAIVGGLMTLLAVGVALAEGARR